MQSLGTHYLAEFHNCQTPNLYKSGFIESCLRSAAEACGATIVDFKFHHFSPYGVSGVLIIEESHFHIHTWPEHKYASIDLYTCNPNLKFHQAQASLQKSLFCENVEVKTLKRGLLPDAQTP